MLKFKLESLSIDAKTNKTAAYVSIMDGQKTIETICLAYNDEESFKKKLKEKTAKIKSIHEEKQIKKSEIEKILEVM